MSTARRIRLFGEADSLRRQYAVATGLFVVLVLAIIIVFGLQITQTLSERYLQDVLISGREGAEEIAAEIGAGGEELFALEKRREVLVRTLDGLPQRTVWESVEVTDAAGNVVYTSHFTAAERLPDELASHLEIDGGLSDQEVTETEETYRISVPLGEVGRVVLSVSKARIAERIVLLRERLLRQTLVVAGVTLLTLVIAFVFVWFLIQRTRRAESQTRKAEELASLGVLAANLAHEIRNPLNSINLNLELLEEDLQSGALDAAASVEETRKEVGRLAGLVSDFLTYARPSTPTMESIDVPTLLEEVMAFLQQEARGLGVHLRMARDLPDCKIHGDPAQLRQVLLNLVLNAIQSVAELKADRRVVELDAWLQDGDEALVTLCVRDRGDGIPESELPKVRAAFHTSRRGGSGLGLAIADRIVTAHEGRVDLKNMEPFGFEARVVLPIAHARGKMSRSRGVHQG